MRAMLGRMTRQYVSFSAEVNPITAQTLQGTCAELVNRGATELYLLLSTPGGNVMHGITVYNFLRGLPAKILTHNIGAIDSIGNVIFLSGEERFACQNSSFMFHGVAINAQGPVALDEKLLRERLDSIKADQRKIGAIIAEHTNLTPDEVADLFLEAKTRDPDDALKNGIVQKICNVDVPPGTRVQQLVFK